MSNDKELAYRYDLVITPDWRERFDTLINESIKLPLEGRFLDLNCGTGSYALELAERTREKGEVIGIDKSAQRVALARAKAQVKKTRNITFEEGDGSDLRFESDEFDVAIGDASLMHVNEIKNMLAEMVRVAKPRGVVILKTTTRGSFDEFFSIYWEALHDGGLDDEVWSTLEGLISERPTVSDAELTARNAGLRNIKSFISSEEFNYETAEDFLASPLIKDYFLTEWLEIVPESNRDNVRRRVVSLIEDERHGGTFDVSVKAVVLTGVK